MHDLTTGRSDAGTLHMTNQAPADWHSKRQSTVETAAHKSKFVAGRTAAAEQKWSSDIRRALRVMGVPIHGPTHVFGDNKSTSSQVLQRLIQCLARGATRSLVIDAEK